MEIVYRMSDLKIVGTVVPNMTPNQEIELTAIPNFGGTKEDYATLDVPFDYFKLEIVDGEVVAVELPPSDESKIEQEPSEADLLGMEITKMKLDRAKDKQLIDTLGQDLAKAKFDIMTIRRMA